MPIIDGKKYACSSCIRGHRVSNCAHVDRELSFIPSKRRPLPKDPNRRKGRPASKDPGSPSNAGARLRKPVTTRNDRNVDSPLIDSPGVASAANHSGHLSGYSSPIASKDVCLWADWIDWDDKQAQLNARSNLTGSSSHEEPSGGTSIKRRGRFSLRACQILDNWFSTHRANPYPTEEERVKLVNDSGLTRKQVNTWLANSRKRQLGSPDPLAAYLSSSSEDEAAPMQSIRDAASRFPSASSHFSPLDLPLDSQSVSPLDSPLYQSYPASISGSSMNSAFDQCPEAIRSKPSKRGRKKYAPSIHSSVGSSAFGSVDAVNDQAATNLEFPDLDHSILSNTWYEGWNWATQPEATSAIPTTAPEHSAVPPAQSDNRNNISSTNEVFSASSDIWSHDFPNSDLQDDSWLTDFETDPGILNAESHMQSIETRAPMTATDNWSQAIDESSEKPTFWCTFCHIKLSQKSWKRHEESQHYPKQEWVCMPFCLPFGDFNDMNNLADRKCVFCTAIVPPSSDLSLHLLSCPKRASECASRPKADRTFSRRDHLKQHIKNFHSTTVSADVLDAWALNKLQGQQEWTCGFCEEKLRDWETRAAHIANHFRNGSTMASWFSKQSWSRAAS